MPDGYGRTAVSFVDTDPGAPLGWNPAADSEESEAGLALYVGRGCASCHGLSGEGTASGPPVLGASARRIGKLTRDGPGGMPAYHESEMSDDDLDAVASFVAALGPAPTETPEQGTPTATPWPSPTPSPTVTPTSTATPEPGATATPVLTPSPTAEPTPTPKPRLTQEVRGC